MENANCVGNDKCAEISQINCSHGFTGNEEKTKTVAKQRQKQQNEYC